MDSLAPGELVTISGSQIGPLETANASLDADSKLPLQLAGTRVLFNPLVSVEQGAITFYLPQDTPPDGFMLEVRSASAGIASVAVRIDVQPRFAILTADGSVEGPQRP